MKRGRCPRCDSSRIAAVDHLPEAASADVPESFQAVGTIHYRQQYLQDGKYLAVTGVQANKQQVVQGSETVTKAGTLEACLCAACGYLEHYVQDPQWLDLGRLDGFEWLDRKEHGSMNEMTGSGLCPKCSSKRIGRLSFFPDAAGKETSIVPRYLGVTAGEPRQLVGRLYGLVCAGCGYVETYVEDVTRLPLDQLDGLSWLERSGPYR